MDEIEVLVRDEQAEERRRTGSQLLGSVRGSGKGSEQIGVKGKVIRERENSIFSEAWIFIAIIFILIGFLTGRNAPFLAIGIGLLVLVALGTWWKRLALSGVTYEREYDRTHIFPGERVTVTIKFNNKKPLPLTWLKFQDTIPIAPENSSEISLIASEVSGFFSLNNTLSMSAYEYTEREVTIIFPKRGLYDLGPLTIQSGDIFTLFTIEKEYQYIDSLTVYPQIWPLEALSLPAKELFGEIHVRRSLFTDPIKTQGIRDYQPQDRFRDVHWKASARRGNLQSKINDPISDMSVITFLNVATYSKHWMGFEPDLLERAISVTASIANYVAKKKWGIGLFVNGSMPGSDQPLRVPPGRSPDQLIRILEALAITTEFATGSIDLLMHRESKRLPWAATLVLITAIVTEEMLASLLRLKEAGRRVVLISLSLETVPGIAKKFPVYQVPYDASAFKGSKDEIASTIASLSAIPVPGPIRNSEGESLEMADTN